MDPKFIQNSIPSGPYLPARKDFDQMADTPTRGPHHRRAVSETFFHFPDFNDMMLEDNLDLFPIPPPLQLPAHSTKVHENKPPAHLRSLSVDADFFEGLMLDAPSGAAAQPSGDVGPGLRHRHSNSMDGYSSATSSEVDSMAKKAMATERLAELSLIDPKRAKRILANRQSAAKSKERKVRYTGELERKVQTLQTEATTLSAQITLLQRDATGLTAENRELNLKLEGLEQQAHLRDALNETLRDEVQRLRIEAGHIPSVNGSNKGFYSSSQSPTFHYLGDQPAQQPCQIPQSNKPRLNGQSQPDFQ